MYKEKFNYITIKIRFLIFDHSKNSEEAFLGIFVRGDYDIRGSVCIFPAPLISVVIGGFAGLASSFSS
jgi:hypothetical protein